MTEDAVDRKGKACSCQDHDQEVRCECGTLIAKVLDGKIELKCRRCKRLHTFKIG